MKLNELKQIYKNCDCYISNEIVPNNKGFTLLKLNNNIYNRILKRILIKRKIYSYEDCNKFIFINPIYMLLDDLISYKNLLIDKENLICEIHYLIESYEILGIITLYNNYIELALQYDCDTYYIYIQFEKICNYGIKIKMIRFEDLPNQIIDFTFRY